MKSWDIQRTLFKVADFVNWSKNDELDLSPLFQRRAVWSNGAKSYLIDTILRGLPIPPVILRDLPPDIRTFRSVREVVDGQQRLRTVLSFVAPQTLATFDNAKDPFTISKSHNAELANLDFRKLDKTLQQRLLNYQFMVNIFPSETDDRDILEIFARMNATGTKLNNQELRNAEFFGEFKTRAFSLASEHLTLWREWRIFSESQIARMAEVEFISELMILLTDGIENNNKKVIDGAYEKFDETFPHQAEISRRIRGMLELLNEAYRGSPQKKILASKSIVYPLFAAVYDLAYGLGSSLAKKNALKIPASTLRRVGENAVKVIEGRAPKSVQVEFEARASQAKNRRTLVKFLTK